MKTGMTAGVVAVALAVTAGVATAPTGAARPVDSLVPEVAPYTPPAGQDFSNLTWPRAFRAMVNKIEAEYAFTAWKGIDFAVLRAVYQPLIRRAWQRQSQQQYYLTLRAFSHEFRDGHVSVSPDNKRVMRRLAGGGFGMTVAPLDDRSIGVTWAPPNSVARRAGIRPKARLVAWDGLPIRQALRAVDTRMSPSMPTNWRLRWERSRYLVRARVGEKVAVTFRNRGSAHDRTVVLKARRDGLETLNRTSLASVLAKGEWPRRMVEREVLDNGYGYIRVYAEIDLPPEIEGNHTPTVRLWRRAIRDLRDTPGLIVDVRGNSGGSDEMVAKFLSSFTLHRRFYEYQNYRVPGTELFQIWRPDEATGEFIRPGAGVPIRPRQPRYRAPVVALIDNATISSGEGIAMGVAMLPRGRVVGFSPTNGSFGMAGAGAVMPGGYEVRWPFGQSLDQDAIIQVDSREGIGGVAPDPVVPTTARNARRYARGYDVVLAHGVRTLASLTGLG